MKKAEKKQLAKIREQKLDKLMMAALDRYSEDEIFNSFERCVSNAILDRLAVTYYENNIYQEPPGQYVPIANIKQQAALDEFIEKLKNMY